MKRSSGPRAFFKIFAFVTAIVVALGYYGHVHAQSGTGAIRVPLRPLAPLSTVPVPHVFGMDGILADKTAAIQLGKALFWDMQAGSDDTQACATCHLNAGADSRATNQVNPGQAGGDNTFQLGGPNYHYNAGSANSGFGGYHDGDFPFRKLSNVNDRFSVTSDTNDVSGSQGVFATNIVGINLLLPNDNDPQGGIAGTVGGGNGDGNLVGGGDDAGLNYGKDARGIGGMPRITGISVTSSHSTPSGASTSLVQASAVTTRRRQR